MAGSAPSKPQKGIDRPSPAQTITDRERGLRLPSLADAVQRLTEVRTTAVRLYPRQGLFGRNAFPESIDAAFLAVLGWVYRGTAYSSLQSQVLAYKADFDLVIAAVELESLEWALTEFSQQRLLLTDLRNEMFLPKVLKSLRQAARAYENRFRELPKKYELIHDAPGPRLLQEDPFSRAKREGEALAVTDNVYLRILFAHPIRANIFAALAEDGQAGPEALSRAFQDAKDAIKAFRTELQQTREHVWRYPPLVAGGVTRLGFLQRPFFEFVMDVARQKAKGKWDDLLLTTGIVIGAAGLVVSGPVGWALLVGDLAVSGMTASAAYMRARENDMALAASVFRNGIAFSNEASHYGEVAFAGAAALLTALQIANGVLKVAARLAERIPRGVGPGLRRGLEGAAKDVKGARGALSDVKQADRLTETPGLADRAARADAAVERGAGGATDSARISAVSREVPERVPPRAEPSESAGHPGGGAPMRGRGRGHRGATAEGVDESFAYEYHPQVEPPDVERGVVRDTGDDRGVRSASEAPSEPTSRFSDLEEGVPPSEAELVHGPLDEGVRGQWLHPQQSLPESVETARRAGVPDVILGDSWVMTRADLPDIVRDSVALSKPAPPRRPTLGRQVSLSEVQNLEVRADLRLTQDALEGSGARIVDVRIDQTQVSTLGGRAGTNRPDLQLTILESELSGRRIYVEYDRSPPKRALDHARRILVNDPEAIVILKVIDFEP
jgi:hypothetical protein